MKLIPNWKQCFRFYSTWFQAAAAALFTYITVVPDALLKAWLILPEDIKTHFSPTWIQGIGIALIIAGIIARLIKQPRLNPPVGPEGEPDLP